LSFQNHETHFAGNLVVPHMSATLTGFCGFPTKLSGPGIWNLIPESIRVADHPGLFKSKLKRRLFGWRS